MSLNCAVLPHLGIQNGTRLKLLKIYVYALKVCTIPTDPSKEPVVAFLPRILFELTVSCSMLYVSLHNDAWSLYPLMILYPLMQTGTLDFKRRQFPVRLAYAISANRLQGGTYIRIGLDARSPFFAHGQNYVVQSRVSRRTDFGLAGLPALIPGERHTLVNIVYRDMINPDTAVVPQVEPPRLHNRVPLLAIGVDPDSDDSSGACQCLC